MGRARSPSSVPSEPPTGSTRVKMRILGVDPGTLKVGYAIIEATPGRNGAVMRYLECGVIAAPAREQVAVRLLAIATDLGTVIDEFSPTTLAIEQAFGGKNIHSALTLGQARGALMLLAGQRGLPSFEYAPALVKRVVAGHGAATKQDVADRVRLLFDLRTAPPADAADALAIACCHALSCL